MCGWQLKLCDPSLTRAIPDHFRDEFLMTKCYTNLRLLYCLLLLYLKAVCVPAVATKDVDSTVALYGGSLTLTMQRRRQRRPRVAADVVHLRCHDIATIAGVCVAGGNKQVVAMGNHHVIATTLHHAVIRQ